ESSAGLTYALWAVRAECSVKRDLSSASAHFVLNFSDPAPPSPRGVLANATPRRFPLRLITRKLSSGIWPSAFNSFSKSVLNVASASTIASKDFFTAAGRSSASMFCHFNSSFAIAVVHRPLRQASLSGCPLFLWFGFPHDWRLILNCGTSDCAINEHLFKRNNDSRQSHS